MPAGRASVPRETPWVSVTIDPSWEAGRSPSTWTGSAAAGRWSRRPTEPDKLHVLRCCRVVGTVSGWRRHARPPDTTRVRARCHRHGNIDHGHPVTRTGGHIPEGRVHRRRSLRAAAAARLIEDRDRHQPIASPRARRSRVRPTDLASITVSSGIPTHQVVRERSSCVISVRFRRSAPDSREPPAVCGPSVPVPSLGAILNVDTLPPDVDIAMSIRRRDERRDPYLVSNDRQRQPRPRCWHGQRRCPQDRTYVDLTGTRQSVYR